MAQQVIYPSVCTSIYRSNPYSANVNPASLSIGWAYAYYSFVAFDLGDIPYKKVISGTYTYFYERDGNDHLEQAGYPGDWSFTTRIGYYKTTHSITEINYANFKEQGYIETPKVDSNWIVSPGNWYTRPLEEKILKYKNTASYIVAMYPITDQFGLCMVGRASNTPYLTVQYEDLPPLPPTALYPDAMTVRNSKAPIVLTWRHNKNAYAGDEVNSGQPAPLEDTQVSATVRYQLNGGAWTEVPIADSTNTYTIPANTFSAAPYGTVSWQVKTATLHNGESGWSNAAAIQLGDTPPNAPTPVYPVNLVVTGGIMFEWRYESLYDTVPSGYDLLYRVDGGAWAQLSKAAADTYATIAAITTTSTVEWQVRVYNSFGEVGPYSSIVGFTTGGTPVNPTILSITNSARPTITWAAEVLQSWDMQIRQGDDVLVNLESQPHLGAYQYKTKMFLDDGTYAIRIRIKNEYGFYSDWVEHVFTISTAKPARPDMAVVDNPDYSVRMTFSMTGAYALIYRTEERGGPYLCIGKTLQPFYDDYTAQPDKRYVYFVRSVDANESFSDSGKQIGFTRFYETTLAKVSALERMTLLKYNLDAEPEKSLDIGNSVSFVHFQGRRYPVADVDNRRTQSRQFVFFVRDYQPLEEMTFSGEPLLLRDNRLGAAVGYIDGGISVRHTAFGGYTVSFTFTRIDYPDEVDIDD